MPSISLVKGCSDQREILSDATDQNFNSKSIEDDVAERENRVNSSDTVYLGLRAGLQITARPLANATKFCLWATRNQKLVAHLATRIMGWIIKMQIPHSYCFTIQASILVTCTVKVFIL